MAGRKNIYDYVDFIYNFLQRYMEITRDEVFELARLLEMRQFGRKQKIVDKGEVDQYLNMIVKGVVRKYVETDRGTVTLQIAQEGHIIQSDKSFHQQVPSRIVIEPIEKTVLVSLSYENLQRLMEMSERWEQLASNILMLLLKHREERIFKQRAFDAREYFMHFLKHHPDIIHRVPQKIIASFLGVKPETFSRLKHIMKGKRMFSNNIG